MILPAVVPNATQRPMPEPTNPDMSQSMKKRRAALVEQAAFHRYQLGVCIGQLAVIEELMGITPELEPQPPTPPQETA